MQQIQRNSNIELLRVVMMLAIIAHHMVFNSHLLDYLDFGNLSFNMIFSQFFGLWGKIAINVFTLITDFI